MKSAFTKVILKHTGAKHITRMETIQSLWSGYGEILRVFIEGGPLDSVVVKHVQLYQKGNHPRGWNTDISHQRKLKSYEVETQWYQIWANACNEQCRIPKCLAIEHIEGEVLMVLEDLDASGFPERKTRVTLSEIKGCLEWLAHFHATFMDKTPEGLWQTGTYWHLETRPDELRDLSDKPLKKAAEAIDRILTESPFQTFVHGDAKLANFCFSAEGTKIAAVDFQYVGGGCGMKDVAYFIGSCLYEGDCETYEKELLDFYFNKLRKALTENKSPVDIDDLEENWRSLYPLAWTDFHRFLKGWSPGHWKINSYSERLAREVIEKLKP